MQVKSVLVIGGGITGVAAAEWLRRDGWQTTLVDRIFPGQPDQTSFGNAGLLARTSVVPVSMPGLLSKAPGMLFDPDSPLFLRWGYLPKLLPWLIPFLRNGESPKKIEQIARSLSTLTYDTTDQHYALSKGTPAEKFIRIGELVSLYRDKTDFEADHFSNVIRLKFDLEPEHLNRKQLIDRDEHLGPSYTFGTMFKDYGWITCPSAYTKALFDYFLSQSGHFKHGEVVDIRAAPPRSDTGGWRRA